MSKFVRFAFNSAYRNYSVNLFTICERNPRLLLNPIMAQKSIMSFFSKTPVKPVIIPAKEKVSEDKLTPKKEVKLEDEDSCSPLKIKGKGSKRLRIDSSDGDSNSPPEKRVSTDVRETEQTDAEVKKESQDSSKENIEEAISENEVEKSPVVKKTKESDKQVKSVEKKTPKNSKKESNGKKKSAEKKTTKSSKKESTPKSLKKEQPVETKSAEKKTEKDLNIKNAIPPKEEKVISSSESEEDVGVAKKKKSNAKKNAISSCDEEDIDVSKKKKSKNNTVSSSDDENVEVSKKNKSNAKNNAISSSDEESAEKMDCSEEKCEDSDKDSSTEKDDKKSPKDEKNVKESPKDKNNVKESSKVKKIVKESPKDKKNVKGSSNDKKNVKESPNDKKNVKESPSQPKKAFNSFFTSVKKTDQQKDGSQTKKETKTSGNDYDPAKLKYHPIDDAIWSKDEKVPYLALSKTLEKIEAISARLKIVEILSNFLRSVLVLTPCDFLPSVYLCLNRLAPAYESVELGIAETTLMKAIAQCTGRTMAQVKADCNSMGDLGLVAEQSKSNQRVMFQPAPLTIRGVFDKLKDIAQMSGHASMAKKVDKIQAMLVACRHSESRYLMRSLAGKLRVGLAEQSVLQAIAQACTATPPLSTQGEEWPPKVLNAAKGLTSEQFKALVDGQALILKTTYCSCPNYDKVIPIILQYGIPALPEHCRLTPGVPLKPMLAHPTKGVHEVLQRFENVEFTCEWKYDGERAQIHVPSKEVDGVTVADVAKSSIYSRNQENNTSKYPDVLGRLVGTMKDSVQSCVLDCEAVAWDKEKKQILPFQVLSTRKKKDANEADIKVAVCLFMFDLLYFNGESLVKKPFEERRRLLRENFVEVEGEWHMATSLDCSKTESIQEFLEESVRGNCEGLMVKTLNGKDATYEIAKRSRNWLKLKKDYLEGVGDTIDAVVLGGYLGRGKRAGVYGGFLLGCHDRESDEYQSLCKIGTGFSDQDLSDHIKSLAEHLIPAPKGYYRYDPSLEPDHWFDPVQVWEVKCADLSLSPIHRAGVGIVDPEKGISLRFPRFIRVRTDKTAEEATSAQQIAELYCNQDQVKNQTANANKNFEDDFY